MGYRLPDKTALVRFEGTDYDGAEVRLRLSVSLGEYFRILEYAAKEHPDSFESAAEPYRYFATVLVSWNLEEDDGTPIPATYDGMLKVKDAGFISKLMEAWRDAIQNPPAPLAAPSDNGSTSEGALPVTAR